ncbi:MAG: alpha/beta hydrolase [Planctomycetaceae bacterium]|nr:alpha/beta hydrolase [Planctomycetaceae bacterium]
MPVLKVNGAELYYEEHGSGAETIVFAHGLLWSGLMFEKQVAALKDRYRCITFDFRGQGQSEVTQDGYDMDTLCEDAAALIEGLNASPCHFLGLSMGGFIGMRLALRRPELLRSLILVETTADPEPQENVGKYRLLNFISRWIGMGLVAGKVEKIMFGQKFLTDPDRADERKLWRQRAISNHKVGISRATNGVIDRQGVYDDLDKITTPTLILVGDQDLATVPAKSERMHARIAGSQLKIIPGAGHTSSVEEPEAVNAAIEEFLSSL